jgi:regulator of RNase E activity RraA
MPFIDQIIRQNELSSVDLRSMFEDVEVSQVSDVMGRQTGTDGSLKRYSGRGTVVGRAVTVRTRAGDNLIVHKALDMIRDEMAKSLSLTLGVQWTEPSSAN